MYHYILANNYLLIAIYFSISSYGKMAHIKFIHKTLNFSIAEVFSIGRWLSAGKVPVFLVTLVLFAVDGITKGPELLSM